MFRCSGYAALAADAPLTPFAFERRELLPTDVAIEVLFCGVCHSDLHRARNEWGDTCYPYVPGHEVVGRVVNVGDAGTRFKAGDLVGVRVDSCRVWASCREGLEQYCETGATETYNSLDRLGRVHLRQQLAAYDRRSRLRPRRARQPGACGHSAASLRGTIRHWGVGSGQKVGVVGLGGLGHMGVKLAHALGAQVVLFTTSPRKLADARRLGAGAAALSADVVAMARHASSLDFLLDSASAHRDLNAYLSLLRRDGTLVQIGAPPQREAFAAGSLLGRRRRLANFAAAASRKQEKCLSSARVQASFAHRSDRRR
jgi:uncharacterized zinc-type alcohol dehydrogenase-like protein